MATLVLTAVGSVLGGPIGAAIGAAVGNVIDHTVLFPPKGREGPRLSALQVQTSSYGTPIQRVYGTMRIGGCVIWSTELIESSTKSSGGKGQPSMLGYSYSVSFAVALSGRPITGVGRIWADGKLLRGSDGVFKSETGFRLHPGGEDQAVDPLLASAEGAAAMPSHRGIAYVVFEHFQLADYGNRIPSLTFEVIADSGPVAVAAIIRDLSDGTITGTGSGDALTVDGFAAYGDSVRSAIIPLAQASGAWFAPVSGPGGDGLLLRGGVVPDMAVDNGDTVAEGAPRGANGRSIAALESVARQVTLSHYDPARDYQIGVQRARRPAPGTRDDRIDFPAAIDAGTAKTIAERTLARAEAGRERRIVTLGWGALTVPPGACVTIRGVSGVWRVARWSFERQVVTLECERLAAPGTAARASPGHVLPAPDIATGTTLLAAFEALPFDDAVLGAPRVTIVAAGTQPGWRRAAVLYSTDDGANWVNAGATAAPGVIGRIAAVPGVAGATLIDRVNTVEVVLAHDAMTLAGADPVALAAGANTAMLGDELFQFGVAEQIGAMRWRLSLLLRGRRGTEWAIGSQQVGDRFALLDAGTALSIDLPIATLGGALRILATGPSDSSGPASATLVLTGASIVPPSPVLLRSYEVGDGQITLQWVRRSRNGWQWIDGVDAPLGEEREAYRVTLDTTQNITTSEPRLLLALADRVGGVTVSVRQVGACGESRPTQLWVPPWII